MSKLLSFFSPQKSPRILEIVFVVVGVVGIILELLQVQIPIFTLNYTHDIVFLVFALLAFVAVKYGYTKWYLLGTGIIFVLLGVYGLFITPGDVTFLHMQLSTPDDVLHTVIGLYALVSFVLGMQHEKPETTVQTA